MGQVVYEEKPYRTILNKLKWVDGWFWCRYTINTYQGCEFACTYCDSRSHRYHLHRDRDHIIYVKKDVKRMLHDRLRRARTLLPDVVVMSGTSDPYQPAEARYRNTRDCSERGGMGSFNSYLKQMRGLSRPDRWWRCR